MAWSMKAEAEFEKREIENNAREDERNKLNIQLVKSMKKDNLPIATIQKYTGLTKEEIEKV